MSKLKFDRSQFKATKVATLTEQSSKVDELSDRSSGERVKVIELAKDGSKNKLRIFPKHPGTTSYAYPKCVHFLKVTKTDKDGNVLKDEGGNPKVGKKPIFNSRIHGGTAKDIIDEYINFVYKKAYEDFQDEKQRADYLKPITGWRAGKWIPGIKSQTRWIVYGDLNGKFGRVELPTTVKDKLNEIAAGQDDESGVMVVDPFTDVDSGRKVFVSYNKDETDPRKKYSASIDLARETPLTDAQFDQLAEQKPLEEIYHKVYRRKDFMLAMEGLKTFDEESADVLSGLGFSQGYEVFTYDEFLDTAEEIAGYYPDGDEDPIEEESNDGGDEPDDLPFDSDEANETSDEKVLSDMNIVEMKAYIKAKKLTVRVLPSYSEDQVRQFITEEEALIAEEQSATAEDEIADEQPKKRASRLGGLKDRVRK